MKLAKYVINLEDRKDRRLEMERQLTQINWQTEYSQSQRPTEAAGFPSIGARGCFESHLSQLKRGAEFQCPVVLMEDDLDFSPDFQRRWKTVLAQLIQTDWSIFYPAHYLKNCSAGLTLLDNSRQVRCSHFVMFHPAIVRTVIEELEAIRSRPAGHPLGGPMHVDGAYQTIRSRRPEIKTYIFSPSLGFQRSSRSDIADNIYDRIPAFQPAIRLYLRLKNRFA
jgi:glycosyl transferase family 25